MDKGECGGAVGEGEGKAWSAAAIQADAAKNEEEGAKFAVEK